MRRQHVQLYSSAIERNMDMLIFGHDGLPVLVFPSSEGAHHEYEDYWMVRWLTNHLEEGRLRLYCVASFDSESWYAKHLPLHERTWKHALYDNWIIEQVVPAICADVDDADVRLTTTGCSFGAYHAANTALRYPQRFSHALCMSGVYDIRFLLHGHGDDWSYFNNPSEYLWHANGEHLARMRRTFITLVCGQGLWEDAALRSTRAFWHLLNEKSIPNYMDLWGHDVSHDWHWWREQIVFYMNHLVEGRHPWQNI